jgi:hypothetical protein
LARIGFLGERTVLREKEDRRLDGHGFERTLMDQLHAAGEFARADAGESDAVAMLRVHIRLHLEDKAGDGRLIRLDDPGNRALGGARLRRGRIGNQAFKQFANRIVL